MQVSRCGKLLDSVLSQNEFVRADSMYNRFEEVGASSDVVPWGEMADFCT